MLTTFAYADGSMPNFSHLYDHPNSHYFFTCGAGKLNIFGRGGCGPGLDPQYVFLIKELKKVTGQKKITVEIYNNLKSLDKRRLQVLNLLENKIDNISNNIGKEENKFDLNCKNYKKYFNRTSNECTEYKNSENSKLKKLTNLSHTLATFTRAYKLSRDHIRNIEKAGSNFTKYMNLLKDDLVKINKKLKKLIDQKITEEKRKIAEEKKIVEEKRLAKKKKAEEKRLAEAKRIAEEKRQQELAFLTPVTELEKAQNFLNDVEFFVKINPEEFDIVEIIEFIIATKPILDGVLDYEQIKNIELFKKYTDTSVNFIKYQNAKNDEILSLNLQEVRYEIDKLESFIIDLKKYLQNNMGSDLTPLVLEKINILKDVMNKKNIEELLTVNRDINNFIIKNNIREGFEKQKKKAEEKRIVEDKNIAEEKKVAEEKKIAEQKKKAEEKKIKKENEEKHFYTKVVCKVVKETKLFSEGEQFATSLLGIKNAEMKEAEKNYHKEYCACVENKTKDYFSLERIKEANKQNKLGKKTVTGTPKAMTMNELAFFMGAQAKCTTTLKIKLDLWLKGISN